MNRLDVELVRRSLAAFEEAVDLPDDQRAAWLAERRVSDPNLVTEVERLLLADAHGARTLPTGGLRAPLAPPPDRIGHYRVAERIGGGGMGEVFIGARDDGLFDHLVAIKRVSPSLMPDAARVLFEKERRALARLNHRHIAQLFDGGVDETGVPYLIMELVRGPPLDRYVAARDLSARDIVGQVAAVCDGVQHAHQHLIVHADLKPANILVNEAGDAKIVDFGVARILRDADSDADAIHPQTSAYASPQRRAGGSPAPYDDIYSLGVILRELLTGIPAGSLTNAEAGPSEILRHQTPEGRSQDWAWKRARECAGDLDAIVARACGLVSTGRYPSAAEMADDLRAWLQHRPLKARRDDRYHVLKKFLRRRRLRVIAAVVGALGIATYLSTVSLLYTRADHARALAEQRFTEVRNLAKYLLYDVYDRLERTPRTLAMRHDVAGVAQTYLDQLAQTPSASVEVKREVVESFIRLAELQAGRRHSNLGQPPAAKLSLDHAEQMLIDLMREGLPASEDMQRQIRINLLRASIGMNADQNLEDAGKSLAAARAQLAKLPDKSAVPALSIEALVNAADLANWKSQYADGLKHADKAITLIETLPPAERAAPDMRDASLRVRALKGDALYYLGHAIEAEAEYSEIIGLATAWFEGQPEDMRARRHVIVAHWNLGTTLLAEGDGHAALKELDAAAQLLPPLVDFEPTDDNAIRTETVLLLARAQALVATGRLEQGLASVQKQVEKRRARRDANPDTPEYARSYAIVLAAKADLLAENRRAAEACPLYAEADRIFRDLRNQNRVSNFDIATGGWTLLQKGMETHCRR